MGPTWVKVTLAVCVTTTLSVTEVAVNTSVPAVLDLTVKVATPLALVICGAGRADDRRARSRGFRKGDAFTWPPESGGVLEGDRDGGGRRAIGGNRGR